MSVVATSMSEQAPPSPKRSRRGGRPAVDKPIQYKIKRALDYVLASSAAAIGAPALLAAAAAIRIDSRGPVFFRQARIGRGGRPYRMFKFRTMKHGAPILYNADGSTRTEQNDTRFTRVGRLMRGGVDELPQIINVLRGEMSIVGPRPEMMEHEKLYDDEVRRKLEIRPGITSLAAVVGRNAIPWRERVEIDLKYLDRWSLWLDVRVMIATACLPLGLEPFRFADVLDDR